MIEIKKQIANQIGKITNLEADALESFIETPPDDKMGDYSFPCFRLAKELKKAPQMIAQELADKIQVDPAVFSKIEVVGGYVPGQLEQQSVRG